MQHCPNLLKFSLLNTLTILRIQTQFWTLCFYILIQQSITIITFTQNGDLYLITPPLLLIFIFIKNKFKQENNLYPRTVKRKLTLLKNSFTLLRDSVLILYQALILLKPSFKHSPTISTEYGIDTLRQSISLGIPKCGGTITVAETQTYTDSLDNLKTRKGSKKWSRR